MDKQEPEQFPPVDPIRSGVAGRCPRCGRGKLFAGYLSLDRSCSRCGLDYSFADAGDGPAVFVILLMGFLVVGLALWVETSYGPPIWVHMIIWIPLASALCLLLLRALKGVLINMQYKNSAHEGEIDDG
ncbi:MAG: DUF983 domain-containing protein [Alphaproteobacteria bacterium]|nr:DUF983 domain-containing protein [Alphaproteobacteria bacterium]